MTGMPNATTTTVYQKYVTQNL